MTFKEISRSCDGILQSDDPNEPTVFFEFQMQKEASIYTRIMAEMAIYKSHNADRTVRGVIVFLNRETDLGCEVWRQVADTCVRACSKYYI